MVGCVLYYFVTKNASLSGNKEEAYAKQQTILNSSFAIKEQADFTSSGATRKFEASLIFVEDNLASGGIAYYSASSLKEDRTDCMYDNRKWVDTKTKGTCKLASYLYDYVPNTKGDFEKKIKTGLIKPLNGVCGHNDVCYELIK